MRTAAKHRDLVTTTRLSDPISGRYRVLFVTNMWPDDVRPFYGSFIKSQAKSLMDRGIGVDLVYVRGFESVIAYSQAIPVIARRARSARYDIVHIHYGHTAASSIGIRAVPTVLSYCGEDLLGAPRDDGITIKSRLEVAAFRQIARLATVTITKSLEMEDRLPRSLRSTNYVLPNGVDTVQFAPRDRGVARRELGWAAGERVALFLGNPGDPRKNVELARAACAAVEHDVPAFRLEEAWGIPADKVPTLMNASDCLVFPSRSEGSPNAIKEAMASALPIVATGVGDIPERLRAVAGCYVCPADAASFADGLRRALFDGAATHARERVLDLSVERVAARLEGIYAGAIATHAKLGR